MRDHNDYEIILQVKEGNQEAYELLVSKYSKFIAKIIHKFNLAYHFEDLHQEGLILLYKLSITFDESYNKSFTRYFELAFKRQLMSYIDTLKRRKNKTVHFRGCIADNNHCVRENSVYYEIHVKEIAQILTPTEFSVYTLRELKNLSIHTICQEVKLTEKKTYNALYRAKAKIRQHFATE